MTKALVYSGKASLYDTSYGMGFAFNALRSTPSGFRPEKPQVSPGRDGQLEKPPIPKPVWCARARSRLAQDPDDDRSIVAHLIGSSLRGLVRGRP